MIDLEALAVPAFLVDVLGHGVLAGLRFNTVARGRPELMRGLQEVIGDKEQDGEDVDRPAHRLMECVMGRAAVELALKALGHGESPCWSASLAPLTNQSGRVTAVLGVCHESKQTERRHGLAGDHLSLALQAIHGAEWHFDVGEGAYRGSDEIATLLGEPKPRPIAWNEWTDHVHPQDLGLFLAAPAPEGSVEFRFYATGGDLRWARCSRVAVPGKSGEVEAVLGIMVDITLERERETAWAELATQDPLTGLLNRRGLLDKVGHLQAALPTTACLALFAIDLDRFKATNDRHGHAAGDAVLVEATRRLTAAVGGAICARIGGDELIALTPVSGKAEAQELHVRLQQDFRRPLAFRGRWLSMSASVGAACASGPVDFARLMEDADADLYAYKHARASVATAAA